MTKKRSLRDYRVQVPEGDLATDYAVMADWCVESDTCGKTKSTVVGNYPDWVSADRVRKIPMDSVPRSDR
jgi:hypothetical protein